MYRKKLLSFVKYVTIALLLAVFILGGAGSGIAFTYLEGTPALDVNNFDFIQPAIILDDNGNFYEELQGEEKREVISIDIIPDHVSNAFIAIEDQRFLNHGGVDLQGIAQAALQGIKAGDLTTAGGSTITQQLIKLTHLSPDKNLKRKVQEAYLSLRLENELSKDEILEAYLNKINFAYGHGIQAASKVYFGKSVEDLTIAQAAVLAAIPKAPSTYKPYTTEEASDGSFEIAIDENDKIIYSKSNQDRALAVITKMYELSYINYDEYLEAKEDLNNNDIGLQKPPEPSMYSYFTDALYDQVVQDIMGELFSDLPIEESRSKAIDYVLNSGLTIHSTIDVDIQSMMDENFEDDSLFPRQSSAAINASAEKSKELGKDVDYKPEGAMVVMDNFTGHVKGIVGGRDKKGNLSLNRALRKFQPGSSIKPLTVYAPGIDSKKITLATTYDDVPIKIPGPGKPWTPGNSPRTYSGLTTVRHGLYSSKNVVAIQAWYDIGVDTSVEYGEKFGLDIVNEDLGPAPLALGGSTHGQTPLAMTSAFSAFPNGGVRETPKFYTKIVDANGEVVIDNNVEGTMVISPQSAYLINDVLKDVPKGGTTNISIPNMEIAGKTGTTNDQMHAWYVGYTPYYTAAVWYGYDENIVYANGRKHTLNIGIYGGSKPGPALMWEKVMEDIHKDLEPRKLFDKPDDIVQAKVDALSGKAPSSLSSKVITEMFLPGTVPTEKDDYHVLIGGRVYIQKPSDRFPGPVEAINPNFHPESLAISSSERSKLAKKAKEAEKEKEKKKLEEEKLKEENVKNQEEEKRQEENKQNSEQDPPVENSKEEKSKEEAPKDEKPKDEKTPEDKPKKQEPEEQKPKDQPKEKPKEDTSKEKNSSPENNENSSNKNSEQESKE